MDCPRCEGQLQRGVAHGWVCSECEGVWVESGGLSALAELERSVLETSPLAVSLVGDHDEVALEPQVDCPVCGETMGRHQYCGDSGIVVDRCRAHGVWLDDGEQRWVIGFANSHDLGSKHPFDPPSAGTNSCFALGRALDYLAR